MSNLVIFAFGVIVSGLCLGFLGFSTWEIRRLGNEAARRQAGEQAPPVKG
jgi:hypothetical protein